MSKDNRFTEGIMDDGAVFLDHGKLMKISEVLERLNNKNIDLLKFNNELLNLEILSEEAAEILEQLVNKTLSRLIRIKSKCFRFGLDDFHPKNEAVNRISLAEEIGHLIAMVEILIENKTISEKIVLGSAKEKKEKLIKWYKEL